MPEFNNLLEAEAYYKEESQARAENREPDHNKEITPVEVHENTVFNPDPSLEVTPAHDLTQTSESASPVVESNVEVVPTHDPGVLTPIPQYNSDGTDATVEPAEDEVIEEPSEDILDSPVAHDESSDTPEE